MDACVPTFLRRPRRIAVHIYENRNAEMGALRNGVVQPEVPVAVVVQILAGASYLDLMLIWCLGRSTVYQVFHSTCTILLNSMSFDGFPDTTEKREHLAHGFANSRANRNPLKGCVGALDGIAIRIRNPRASDCINPATYYHRKGYFAIPVQAICDAKYRFVFFSAKCAGPTHDSVAFGVSSYANQLKLGKLPRGFWIAADEAYSCDEYVINPVPSANAEPDSPADGFNFYFSSLRIHIEQSFGILLSRWGILWRPLQFTLAQNLRAVQLAMLLHNYCVDAGDSSHQGLLSEDEHREIHSFARSITSVNSNSLPGRRSERIQSNKRLHLIDIIESLGYSRPRVSPAKRRKRT